MLIPTLYSRFLLKRMAATSTKKVVFLRVCDNSIGISVADKLPADTSSGRGYPLSWQLLWLYLSRCLQES